MWIGQQGSEQLIRCLCPGLFPIRTSLCPSVLPETVLLQQWTWPLNGPWSGEIWYRTFVLQQAGRCHTLCEVLKSGSLRAISGTRDFVYHHHCSGKQTRASVMIAVWLKDHWWFKEIHAMQDCSICTIMKHRTVLEMQKEEWFSRGWSTIMYVTSTVWLRKFHESRLNWSHQSDSYCETHHSVIIDQGLCWVNPQFFTLIHLLLGKSHHQEDM